MVGTPSASTSTALTAIPVTRFMDSPPGLVDDDLLPGREPRAAVISGISGRSMQHDGCQCVEGERRRELAQVYGRPLRAIRTILATPAGQISSSRHLDWGSCEADQRSPPRRTA